MKSKVLTILLSVFVAFGLWLYVVTVEHTQIEMTFYNIPVNWNGEEIMQERDLRLVDRNMTISMKLYGNRSVLNKLKSSDIIVLADLSHISEAGEKHLNYTVDYSGVANNSIDIVDQPASIDVQVARWMDKTIPVQVETTGDLGDTGMTGVRYEIDSEKIAWDLPTVDISGPYEVVENITAAKVFANMSGKTATVEDRMNLVLCDQNGNRVGDVSSVYVSDGGSTMVTIPVRAAKEITLDMEILENDTLLTAEDVTITVNPNIMTIYGSLADVQAYPAVYQLGQISLKDLVEGFVDREFPVSLPEGLSCNITSAKVTLEVSKMVTQTVTVNKVTWGDKDKWSTEMDPHNEPIEVEIVYMESAPVEEKYLVATIYHNVNLTQCPVEITVTNGVAFRIVGMPTVKVSYVPRMVAEEIGVEA